MVINSEEIDLDGDPEKLEAYKCRVCKSWVIGDNELLHEKVSIDDIPPIGFVYIFPSKETHYFIVSYIAGESKLELTEHKLITEDFDNKLYHGYNYNELSFVISKGELHFLKNTSQKDSKELREFLSKKTYRPLNNEGFDRFKELFEKAKKLPIERINLKNLTNKL